MRIGRDGLVPAVIAAVLAAALTGPLFARVYAPRVVSPHNADAYSMKTFARFHRWRGLTGDDLAWEVYKYLTDRRTGLYPMGAGAWETGDVMYDYRLVRDPVKMVNVYVTGYCDVLGPVMAGIWQEAGFGEARVINFPAWQHVAAEVSYGGKWHYLDLDLRAAFRRRDGSLASFAEAARDPSLWTGPRGPRFFPMDRLEHVRSVYAKARVYYRHNVHTSGHTMDFVLRRGETFTRWWRPRGGRWNHDPSYNTRPWLVRLLKQPPAGPKPKHRSYTVHTYGNGRFVYRPDLTSHSSDFADGAYDAENVRPGPEGLTLAHPGKGYAVFEVRTPYVIVPLVGDFETADDDRDASVVEVDARGATLELSRDNGKTWRRLKVAHGRVKVDLTPYVSGTYGYLLRLVLAGRPGEAVVRSLKITTWVQLAPASLPSLRRGINRMEFLTGDHYGLETRVMEVRPNAADPGDLLKWTVGRPADYDPARKTARIRGPFVVRVDAPPGSRIAWFSAGGSFRTYQGPAAARTRNRMAYAVEKPEDFVEFYRARVPAYQGHWHYNAQREVRLAEPARTIFIRYVGEPAVNNVRIYAHCIDENPPPPTPVTITHAWLENGAPRSKTVTLAGPGSYQVEAESDPENVSIELAVPSSRKADKKANRGGTGRPPVLPGRLLN